MQKRDTVIVDMYRRQAVSGATSENNYKGLIINALPGLHDLVGATAMRLFSPNAEILDLASGSGALCSRIRDLGFRPTACDLVDENFKLHGEIPFYSTNLNSEFHELFRDRFDGITATEIIEHLENPRNFLRQCYSTLKPGGYLILTTPNVDSSLSRCEMIRSGHFRWFDQNNYLSSGHITALPLFSLKRALDETQFDIAEITSFGKPQKSDWIGLKMRCLAFLLRTLDGVKSPQGEILMMIARKEN